MVCVTVLVRGVSHTTHFQTDIVRLLDFSLLSLSLPPCECFGGSGGGTKPAPQKPPTAKLQHVLQQRQVQRFARMLGNMKISHRRHYCASHSPASLVAVSCLWVCALLLAPVQCHECEEHSCEEVLNQAMQLVLETANNTTALALRASDMLSASSYQCCLQYLHIRTRWALVRLPPPHFKKLHV